MPRVIPEYAEFNRSPQASVFSTMSASGSKAGERGTPFVERFSRTALIIIALLIVLVLGLTIGLICCAVRLRSLEDVPVNDQAGNPDLDLNDSRQPIKLIPADVETRNDSALGADLRLPKDLKPEKYKLRIRSYLPSPGGVVTYLPEKNFTFDGWVEITILCVKTTNVLILNSMGLNFTESTFGLWRIEGESPLEPIQLVGEIEKLTNQQMAKFTLNQPLIENSRYRFQINYTGPIRDDLSGYYRSSYKENGITRWLAATQFEVNYARRALPCFDEPAFKATFEMVMEHPYDMVVLFNTPEGSKTPLRDGWMETSFPTSPKMSSYLLAYVVAGFEHVDSYTADRSVKFGAWSRPSQINSTKYAAEAGPAVMKFFETYFGVQFPLQKTDQIAIPDFQAGAMENWGLITYDEGGMLYDPQANTLNEKFRVTVTIAHEISHQWFGNIVTMKWWDDLWLNEGFATYMEFIGSEHIDRGGHYFDRFPVLVISDAMEQDQLLTAHPLSVPVHTLEDALANFDTISYDKGAAVLQMLNFTIGEDLFRLGVNNYLKKFAYKNTVNNDLWESIGEKVSENGEVKGWDGNPIDVKAFMHRWVLQAGFPVVTVSKTQRLDGKLLLTLNQSRFTIVENATHNPKFPDLGYDYQWFVPIWYHTERQVDKTELTWLQPHSTVTLELPLGEHEWYLINPDARGYYRVNYDLDNWMKIHRQLVRNHRVFSARTRAQLMYDVFNLASANKLSYTVALDMSIYLKAETHDVPWTNARYGFSVLKSLLDSHPDYPLVEKYLLSLWKPHYNKMGFNGNGVNTNDLLDMNFYTHTVFHSCMLKDANCTAEAINEFQKFRSSCQATAPSCPSRLIDIALQPESTLRVKEAIRLMSFLGREENGSGFVLESMSRNWDLYNNRFGSVGDYLGKLAKTVLGRLNWEGSVKQLSNLIAAHGKDLGESKVDFESALETGKSNILWLQRNTDEILQWIKNQA